MRRAIVTGCSRGIGRAVAEMLLAEGWRVLGISRVPEDGPFKPPIRRRYFKWLPLDISNGPAMAYAGKALKSNRAPFDALVHCAGIRGPHGPLEDNDEDNWVQTIQTNLIGTYHVVKTALPLLEQSDDGRILLFAGGGAFNASPGYSAYAVAKAGVVSLMETLAVELAGTSTTVNCVSPGFVPTTIHDGTPEANRPSDGSEMEQAVACVRHLLSPATRGLTGKTISAPFDDWQHITPWAVETLNASEDGTRTRHGIQRVTELTLQHHRRVAG